MPASPALSTEHLQQEKEKFEALFQYASMGILVVAKGGEVLLANNFLLAQFGYTDPGELVGKKIEQLIPNRYHSHHTKYRDKYNKHPEPRPMGVGKDLFAIKKNGTEFPVEISLSSYTMDGESYTIAFVSDISKRKNTKMLLCSKESNWLKQTKRSKS